MAPQTPSFFLPERGCSSGLAAGEQGQGRRAKRTGDGRPNEREAGRPTRRAGERGGEASDRATEPAGPASEAQPEPPSQHKWLLATGLERNHALSRHPQKSIERTMLPLMRVEASFGPPYSISRSAIRRLSRAWQAQPGVAV